MSRFSRMSVWGRVEAVAAVVFGALAVLTMIDAEWIELVFGVEPDGGDGSLEWVAVLVAAVVAVVCALAARRSWLAVADSES